MKKPTYLHSHISHSRMYLLASERLVNVIYREKSQGIENIKALVGRHFMIQRECKLKPSLHERKRSSDQFQEM